MGHFLSLLGPEGPEEETGVCMFMCVHGHVRGGVKMQQCPLWFTFKAALTCFHAFNTHRHRKWFKSDIW